MSRRSASEVYAAARAAGLSAAQAVIATAIAAAESSFNDTAVGDTSLETNVWGPSVGVWQVRTLKSATGTGSDRDITALQGNLARQAQAMRNLSGGGTNWSPWTVYKSGAYARYLNQATAAAGAAGAVPTGLQMQNTGILSNTLSSTIAPARNLLLKLAVIGAGATLAVIGLYKAFGDDIKRAGGEFLDKSTAIPS